MICPLLFCMYMATPVHKGRYTIEEGEEKHAKEGYHRTEDQEIQGNAVSTGKHPNTIDKYIHIICGICLRDASTRSNRISPSLQMCLGMAISRQRESISNPQAENIKNI